MDRLYTSPELFYQLKKLNIGACVIIKFSNFNKGNYLMIKIKRNDKRIQNKDIFIEK